MISRDQLRAGRAYQAAAGAGIEAGHAQELPMMLLLNGFLATWAFLLSKQERLPLLGVMLDHFRALDDLRALAAERDPAAAFRGWVGTPQKPGLDGRQLRDLSAEALALAGWLKRAFEAKTAPDEAAPANPGDRAHG